ncbi:Glycosyl hydrolases family 25 [Kutzneria sp. CA-103260]|nr:Glycosyl hydrolases family 25 [Kutzneria sp. CA-103260]
MTGSGVDIASYQGTAIDWNATEGNNISFVSVKVTEDTDYTDPYATAQADGARSVGIAAGGYHFARPGDANIWIGAFRDLFEHRTGVGPALPRRPDRLDLRRRRYRHRPPLHVAGQPPAPQRKEHRQQVRAVQASAGQQKPLTWEGISLVRGWCVGRLGLEPRTYGLKVRSSTN